MEINFNVGNYKRRIALKLQQILLLLLKGK